MAKIVMGNFADTLDAANQVEDLLAQGYPRDSISVIANRAAGMELADDGIAIEPDFDYVNDETMWQRIKNFFGYESEDENLRSISAYRDDIRNGHVLVLVEDGIVPTHLHEDMLASDMSYYDDRLEAGAYMRDENNVLRLQEERMDVEKESVKTGEAILRKRIVEETKTVEVPVMREEIVIERRAVNEAGDGIPGTEEEVISIPVMEEQVHVTKTPFVTEEISVHKRDIEETRKVSATLRKEELDVEQSGEVVFADGTYKGK